MNTSRIIVKWGSMFEHLDQELQNLAARDLRRRLTVVEEVLPGGKVRVDGRVLLNLSSNDYLGLSLDPRLIAAAQNAAARWGVGAGTPPGDRAPVTAPAGRRAAGGLQENRRGRHFQHRLHGQPGGDQCPGGAGGHGLRRQAEPRQHL